jgi:Prohead core protein serine protease
MSQVIIDGQKKDVLIEGWVEYQFIKEEYKGKQWPHIHGIFLQANVENRNKRIYPGAVMQNEVGRYVREMVEKNRAVGELGHPDGPSINPERISHKIISLVGDGDDYIGKARISNTPYGKIVQNFLEEEIQFGVSSRGVGSLRRINGLDQVQNDFMLATAADVVMDPSAPSAFVRGIMENKEYIFADGMIQEANIDKWKKAIKTASLNGLRDVEIATYHDFLRKLDESFKF